MARTEVGMFGPVEPHRLQFDDLARMALSAAVLAHHTAK
jgi:hypothetical protein